jgi:DNA-binding transcriptional LysR family regulator
MVVAVRPDHPLAAHEQVQARQLSDHAMVSFESSLRLGRRIRAYLREQGASPEVVDTLDNIDSIKNVISLTQRFAILPKRTIWRELESGTLRAVALTPQLVRPLGVIYRRWRNGPDQPFTPAAQMFVDFLLKHAGPEVDVLANLDAAATKTATPAPALAGK